LTKNATNAVNIILDQIKIQISATDSSNSSPAVLLNHKYKKKHIKKQIIRLKTEAAKGLRWPCGLLWY
jgi:hypothetical protein